MFRYTVFIINTTYFQGTQMDSKYVKAYVSMLNQLAEANVAYQSPSMGGASTTQYDDGSSASNYDAGPLAVQQKKDPTGNMQSNRVRYNTGTDSVQVKDYASGVKKLTVHGPGEDAYVGPDASAQRLGVDPAKVNNFVNQQSDPDQPQTMEEEDALAEMCRLAFGKQELDEVGPQGYAGDDAAYNKYAGARATGDMLNKEMQPEKGVTSFTSPQAKAIATDLSTGLAGANPEMEKRYTMNKLNTATPATDVSGELEEEKSMYDYRGIPGLDIPEPDHPMLPSDSSAYGVPSPEPDEFGRQHNGKPEPDVNLEEDELDAMRRIMNHRR